MRNKQSFFSFSKHWRPKGQFRTPLTLDFFQFSRKQLVQKVKKKTDDPHLSKTHCRYRHCRTTAWITVLCHCLYTAVLSLWRIFLRINIQIWIKRETQTNSSISFMIHSFVTIVPTVRGQRRRRAKNKTSNPELWKAEVVPRLENNHNILLDSGVCNVNF